MKQKQNWEIGFYRQQKQKPFAVLQIKNSSGGHIFICGLYFKNKTKQKLISEK